MSASGMEMMVRSLVKALGVDPNELKEKVTILMETVTKAANQLDEISTKQDQIMVALRSVVHRQNEMEIGNVPGGEDHLGPEFDEEHGNEIFPDGDFEADNRRIAAAGE